METTKMKILYRKQSDSHQTRWQSTTNIDEFILPESYLLSVINDDGSHKMPFRFANDEVVTMVVKNHEKEDRTSDGRTIVQTITRVERSSGKEFTYTRTRCNIRKEHIWSKWEEMQKSIKLGEVSSLDIYTDNGNYSGVYTDGTVCENFSMVVIDNKDVANVRKNVRSVSQFKYSLNLDGTFCFKTRTGQGNNNIVWGSWVDIGAADTTDIQDNSITALKLSTDVRAKIADVTEIKNKALQTDTVHITATIDKISLDGRSIDGTNTMTVDIPAATTEKAGVMSAEDKKSLLAEYDITPCEYTSGYYSDHNNKVESTVGGTSFAKQRIDVTDYSSLVVNSALSGIAGIFITDIEDSILQTVELKDGLALVDLTVLKNVKWLYFTVYKGSMPIEDAYVKGYKKTKDRIDRLEDIVLPQNLKLLQDNNRKDFTWCALGDSMTEINDTSIVGKYITAGYLTRVCREIPNLKYINLGKSGSTIYNTVGLSIPEADVYTIFFGQNDWNTHMALGTVSNFIEAKYDNTVLGSLGALIAKIKKISSSQIIVMTPIESGYSCGRGKSVIGVPSDTPNENGWTITDMADAIRKCLIDTDIICIDTHSLSYISKDNAVKAGYVMVDGVRTKVAYPDFLNYFDSIPSDLDTELYDDSCAYTTYDGVHPSDLGCQILANCIVEPIRNAIYSKMLNKDNMLINIKDDIVSIKEKMTKEVLFTNNGSYFSLSNAVLGETLSESIVSVSGFSYAYIECSAGEEYVLSTNGNTAGAKNYAILDKNNIVLALGNTTALINESVIIPEGGKTLIVNSKTDGAEIKTYIKIPIVNYDGDRLEVNGEIVSLSEEKSSLLPYKSTKGIILSLYEVSIGSQVPIIESTATNYSYIFLPVIKGDKFKINVPSGGTSSARICCVTDKNLLCTFLTTTSSFDGNVDIVEDGYIIINAKNIDSCVLDKIGEIKDCKTNIPYTKKDYYIPLTDVAVGSQYAVAQSGFATDYCYTVRKVYAGQQFFITTTGNTKYAKSYALFDNEMRCLAFATGTQTQTDRHITIWQDGYLVVNSKIDGFSLINIDTISQKLNTEAFSNVKTEVLDARRYTINDYNNEVAFDAAYIGDLTVPALYLDYNRNIPTTGAAISRDISGKKLPTQHSHEEAQAFYVPFLYLDQQKIGTIVLFDEATGNPFIFDKNGNKKFLSYE